MFTSHGEPILIHICTRYLLLIYSLVCCFNMLLLLVVVMVICRLCLCSIIIMLLLLRRSGHVVVPHGVLWAVVVVVWQGRWSLISARIILLGDTLSFVVMAVEAIQAHHTLGSTIPRECTKEGLVWELVPPIHIKPEVFLSANNCQVGSRCVDPLPSILKWVPSWTMS